MSQSDNAPGPPPPPLVPGHMGAPDERTCHAAFTVLAMAEYLGRESLIRAAEARCRDAGIPPRALRELARRRIEQGRWPQVDI